MNDLTIAGTVAGALIAVGTVLRWTFRRALRAATWLAALVRLPAEVAKLATSVTQLTDAVHTLSAAVNPLEGRS